MIPGNANPLLLATAAADAAAAGPIKSLRFNNDDSAYLNRTPSSSGNRRTWTWSCWLKRSGLGVRQEIFAAGNDGTDFFFDSDDLVGCLVPLLLPLLLLLLILLILLIILIIIKIMILILIVI